MSLEERAAFALALWDLAPGDGEVLLASTESAHTLVREAKALDELPDIVTPWLRTRAWATAHRDVPVAPPLTLRALEAAIAERSTRGFVLVDRDAALSFVASGSLARAFVFAARGKKPKVRLDRVQNAFVRAPGAEPVHFKELLRRKRAEAGRGAASDDGKKLAAALVRAWDRSDVELTVAQKPIMK